MRNIKEIICYKVGKFQFNTQQQAIDFRNKQQETKGLIMFKCGFRHFGFFKERTRYLTIKEAIKDLENESEWGESSCQTLIVVNTKTIYLIGLQRLMKELVDEFGNFELKYHIKNGKYGNLKKERKRKDPKIIITEEMKKQAEINEQQVKDDMKKYFNINM